LIICDASEDFRLVAFESVTDTVLYHETPARRSEYGGGVADDMLEACHQSSQYERGFPSHPTHLPSFREMAQYDYYREP
jgi:hypothetical protein